MLREELEGIYQKAMRVIIGQIDSAIDLIDSKQVEDLMNAIRDAARIYVMGAGRSGLTGKGFAMRLMHLGFTSYVVGETTTPAISDKDLLIVISDSGGRRSSVEMAETAKDGGAKIASITSNQDSLLGKISDLVVVIPKVEKFRDLAPLGTFFEDTTMIFADGIVAELMAILNEDEEDLKKRHTKLE
ncbi:MAG: 3-hexulose-6-phosphate isomerase [Candidatus Methanolliviera sp. GoM_oil]|nr:MAG: 3-hexulose-6-phosphate isomerase [Candidatus Methanolliviera sp. GoM_oil]